MIWPNEEFGKHKFEDPKQEEGDIRPITPKDIANEIVI